MLAAKRQEARTNIIDGSFQAEDSDRLANSGSNYVDHTGSINNNNAMAAMDDERVAASHLHQFASGGGSAALMHQRNAAAAAAAAELRFPPEAVMSGGMNPALWAVPSMNDMYRHSQPMSVLSGIPMEELAAMAAGGYHHPSAAFLHHHQQQQQLQHLQQHNEPLAQAPFNDLDSVALQKGNLAEMSEQQRNILLKLESGFKGTVEELIAAVGS